MCYTWASETSNYQCSAYMPPIAHAHAPAHPDARTYAHAPIRACTRAQYITQVKVPEQAFGRSSQACLAASGRLSWSPTAVLHRGTTVGNVLSVRRCVWESAVVLMTCFLFPGNIYYWNCEFEFSNILEIVETHRTRRGLLTRQIESSESGGHDSNPLPGQFGRLVAVLPLPM